MEAARRQTRRPRSSSAGEEHLPAGGALRPEIVRHLAPPEQRADFRADIFGEPAHAGPLVARDAGGADGVGQRAHLVQHAAHRVGRRVAVGVEIRGQRVDQRRGDHRGVGDPHRLGGLAGVRTPKPMAIGRSVALRMRGMAAGEFLGAGGARAGDAGDADVVDEARAALEHVRQARVVGGGRDQADDVEPVRGGDAAASMSASSVGRSTTISPSTPAPAASVQKAFGAVGQDRVEVAHQDDRRRGVVAAEVAHHARACGTAWRRPSARACRRPG